MNKKGFLGEWLPPYIALLALTTVVWLVLLRTDSCVFGFGLIDVDICFGTGRQLAMELAPDVVIALGLVMVIYWLLRKFRPRTRVTPVFIASLVLMLPLTVTIGVLRAASTLPKITGTITSLPMNQYVLIRDKSGRSAVVFVEHDEEMGGLSVGDKIRVCCPGGRWPTIQSWFSDASFNENLQNFPSRLRDLPGNTPFVVSLNLKVLRKSTAPQPTQWLPVASFDGFGQNQRGHSADAPPFSVNTERWRISWTATLPGTGELRFDVRVLRVARDADLTSPRSNPHGIGSIYRSLHAGETVRGTFFGYGAGTFYARCSGCSVVQWRYTVEELR